MGSVGLHHLPHSSWLWSGLARDVDHIRATSTLESAAVCALFALSGQGSLRQQCSEREREREKERERERGRERKRERERAQTRWRLSCSSSTAGRLHDFFFEIANSNFSLLLFFSPLFFSSVSFLLLPLFPFFYFIFSFISRHLPGVQFLTPLFPFL